MPFADTDIYCSECGAQFSNDCHCDPVDRETNYDRGNKKTWTGMDGHVYEGYENEPTAYAEHSYEKCRCPNSANFDPDNWY